MRKGSLRIRSTRLAGISVLAVEIKDGKHWEIVDIFTLSVWLQRPAARQELTNLVEYLESQGYSCLGWINNCQNEPSVKNI